MNHSLPEFTPKNDPSYTEPGRPIGFYNNQGTSSLGIPNYSTIESNSLSGSYRKPLANPNLTSPLNRGETMPNHSIEINPDVYPTIPEDAINMTPINVAPNRQQMPAPNMPPRMAPGMPTPMTPNMPPRMAPGMPTPMTPNMPPRMAPGMPTPMTPRTAPGMIPRIRTTNPGMTPGSTPPANNLQSQSRTMGNSYDSCDCKKDDTYMSEPPYREHEYMNLPYEYNDGSKGYCPMNSDSKMLPDYYSNMVTPDYNKCRMPIGVPMLPLYGYDNCEDADKDWDYMKQMYPLAAKKLFHEIDEECDKLEYDGSCMFDEYPDKVYLGRIVDRIYTKCKYLEDEMPEIEDETNFSEDWDNDLDLMPYQYNDNRPGYDHRRRPRRPHRHDRHNYPPYRREPWLRDLIEVILYNEMLNRRRRYRGRKRWF